MPGARWDVPATGWHYDRPFDGAGSIPAINVFVFLDTVEPRGGGTTVLAGSHRLVEQYTATQTDTVHSRELKSELGTAHPWLQALWDKTSSDGRVQRFMLVGAEIDGIPLHVVELTGEPGDAVLMHSRSLHAAAPNVSPAPRMMLAQLIGR